MQSAGRKRRGFLAASTNKCTFMLSSAPPTRCGLLKTAQKSEPGNPIDAAERIDRNESADG